MNARPVVLTLLLILSSLSMALGVGLTRRQDD